MTITEVLVNFAANLIAQIPSNHFDKFEAGTGKFSGLNLGENLLKRCPTINAPDLRDLSLQRNAITLLEPGALDKLVNLRELNLDANRITCLLEGFISKTNPGLQRFQFDNNPLGAVSPAG